MPLLAFLAVSAVTGMMVASVLGHNIVILVRAMPIVLEAMTTVRAHLVIIGNLCLDPSALRFRDRTLEKLCFRPSLLHVLPSTLGICKKHIHET